MKIDLKNDKQLGRLILELNTIQMRLEALRNAVEAGSDEDIMLCCGDTLTTEIICAEASLECIRQDFLPWDERYIEYAAAPWLEQD